MLYLSQLLGAPLEDQQGERVGKIIDARTPTAQVGQEHPAYLSSLVIEGEEEQQWRIPPAGIERHEGTFLLRAPLQELTRQPLVPEEQELSLAQEVLDKQVIDFQQKKAVRVNDVSFADDWQILGIDATTFGLVRRVAPAWLLTAIGRNVTSALIPWSSIEPLGGEQPEEQEETGLSALASNLPQRTPSGHLADMHPADIAGIVHQLTPGQGARLIEGLDDETAADIMEEVDTERQRHILENIPAERAADILQAMGPDEAADLLAQLPEERAQELLRLMTPEESEDVQELLGYKADTAGGLMTTDYLALSQTHTVAEALEAMRTNILENDLHAAYIYCVEDDTQEEYRLLGVTSLWDLLVAEPTRLLQDVMERDFVKVDPDSDARSVAETMAKYNLLAIPVVNEEQVLEGVVTVDDALDVLLPPERRRRPTRMY